MDEIISLGLVALIALGIPVMGVAGFFMALSLKRRVTELERRLGLAELGGIVPAPLPAPPPLRFPATQAPTSEAPPPAIEPVEIASAARGAPEEQAAAVEPPAPPPAAPPVQSQPSFEERFGARWTVWVGGVALALGGLFLVRYSIEQGLLGPGARVTLGMLFALALVGAGEWLRRREKPVAIAAFEKANVPAVLTAAGTATAFATVYAAYALYDLIAPALAFVLLGAVALVTMAAALLHGPGLAALGLLGALGAPLLVTSEAPNLWALAIYLAFVVAAAYAVARLRFWKWLARAAAIGAILWTFPLDLAAGGDLMPVMAHLIVQMALAGFFLVAHAYRGIEDERSHPDRLASGILAAFAVLVVLVSGSLAMGDARPVFAAIAALMLAGLAFRYAAAAPLALAAAFVAAGTMLLWPIVGQVAEEPFGVFPDLLTSPRPQALGTFLSFALLLPGAVALLSLARLALGPRLPLTTAAFFAGAATLGPLAALAIAWWRVAELERSLSFALVAGLLALAFVGGTVAMRKRASGPLEPAGLGTGALATAAIGALSLGLTFALDKGMLTVAFALTALGTAWVADRTAIPILRAVVAGLGLVVLGRLLWDPTIVGGDPGATPIFNWLLVGYGVPALAFLLASRILEKTGRDRIVRFVESLAILFAALLAAFEIRHLVRGGDILAPASDHLEAGLMATVGLGFSLVMTRAQRAKPDIVYHVGSLVFGALSMLVVAGCLVLVCNPFLLGEPVIGGPVINSLLAAYLLPGLMAAGVAVAAREVRPRWYVRAVTFLALTLPALYVLLEIRRLFQGPRIAFWHATGEAELWTYSIALLAFGILALGLGLLRDWRAARLVSAGCILAAVLKVFVIDLANLEGVARALSFIALGLVLVGIGFVYQKLLARRPVAPPPEEKPVE